MREICHDLELSPPGEGVFYFHVTSVEAAAMSAGESRESEPRVEECPVHLAEWFVSIGTGSRGSSSSF